MGEVILQIQSSLCPIPHIEVSNTDPKKEPQGSHQLNSMVIDLWCLMPLSTIFQLYRGSLFYWWRKPDYPEKTTNLQFNIYNLMWLHMFQYITSENCKLKKCKNLTPSHKIYPCIWNLMPCDFFFI